MEEDELRISMKDANTEEGLEEREKWITFQVSKW